MPARKEDPEFTPSREAMARMAEFYGVESATEHLDPLSIREYWFEQWRSRIATDYDVYVVWTGQVGVGKSSAAIEAATHIDPTFTADHIAYTPIDLIDLIDKCQPGQVIVYDEAVLGVLATDTFKEEQRALVKCFATMRSKRLVLFLCIPNIFLLAKGIREERMTHWVAIVDRGIAYIHTKNIRVRYKTDPTLGVSIDRVHGPYTWKPIDNTRLWKEYLELKKKRIHEFLSDTKDALVRKHDKELGRPRSKVEE